MSRATPGVLHTVVHVGLTCALRPGLVLRRFSAASTRDVDTEENSADALHSSYTATRSQGFGPEVQVRSVQSRSQSMQPPDMLMCLHLRSVRSAE